MSKENFDFENSVQEPAKKKYADLDLGLDFDLSFLDDIDESVLDAERTEEKTPVEKKPAAPKKEAPVKKEAKKPAPAPKEAPAKKAAPAKKPASTGTNTTAQQGAPVKKAPVKKPAASAEAPAAPAKKQPAVQEEPVKSKKQKKGPRLGGVIFYTLYFLFILVFFVATYIGLQWLQDWLVDYELSQPTVKAQQVFDEVFTDPDWGALYDSAGAQDSPYEGKEEYITYMENKVGSTPLTYLETSAGLSGDKKYLVRLGEETVASFTLKDRNQTGDKNLENLENITDIPDWVLGAVEVFFEREEVYNIVKLNGHTAYVNDVALDDSFTIQKATTIAENYLPEGTTGFITETQQITGLMEVPTVVVKDEDGNVMEVTYDEATKTFTERTESNTMSEEEKEVALKAAEVSSLWMIEAVRDRGEVAKYFEPSSDAYNYIVKSTELWVQDYSSYEFANQSVTDYARYTDTLFSVRVKMDLVVTRLNGTSKTTSFDQSMFFEKGDSGKWLCFESTNIDVSEPVGKVRLTFKQGDDVLHTDFYETDAKEVITPNFSIGAGQVFSGWITISENEDGATVYNLEFVPDETGVVKLPEGTTLKPMTLYAFIQNENEVQQITEVPAETTAETTAAAVNETLAETAAETTAAPETVPAETTQGA